MKEGKKKSPTFIASEYLTFNYQRLLLTGDVQPNCMALAAVHETIILSKIYFLKVHQFQLKEGWSRPWYTACLTGDLMVLPEERTGFWGFNKSSISCSGALRMWQAINSSSFSEYSPSKAFPLEGNQQLGPKSKLKFPSPPPEVQNAPVCTKRGIK